jgi:DNA-binding MarR family transcriptional regulator
MHVGIQSSTSSAHPDSDDADALADAVLAAADAMVSVAARSLAWVSGDVTLSQYRAMVELAPSGGRRLADLAKALDVDRSAATRISDRLASKDLVRRTRLRADRRAVRVSLTNAGRELIDEVSVRRDLEVSAIAERLSNADQNTLASALRAFAEAAARPGTFQNQST